MENRRPFLESILARSRWFYLGMGIKRWLLLLMVGAANIGVGLVYLLLLARRAGLLPEWAYHLLTFQFMPPLWRMLVLLGLGTAIIALAVMRLGSNLVAPFRRPGERVLDSLYRHSRRGRGPHVVAIGGGTGLPSLLRGLREHTSNITAIVTVADDGGSSGRLRRELGLLPPGDFRNNLAALSRDEALMTQLLQYRFGGNGRENGRGELQGHAFGNLLLAALTGITGSFDEALLAAQRVLAIRGRVLPSTLENVTLVAEVEGGETTPAGARRVVGESAIPKAGGRIRQLYLDPAGVRVYPPVLQALFQADLIVLGPGSLYTSILPNLLVRDLAQALRLARAPRVYVCNLATQPGETNGFDAADHVDVLLQHVDAACIDVVLANDNLSVPADTGGGETIFVEPTWPPTRPGHMRLVTADLVDEAQPWRHDSKKLARSLLDILHGAKPSAGGA